MTPQVQEIADKLLYEYLSHGWKLRHTDTHGYGLFKEFDTAVGVKEANLYIYGVADFPIQVWGVYTSEGRNVLESCIRLVNETQDVKVWVKHHNESVQELIDQSYARNLYLQRETIKE